MEHRYRVSWNRFVNQDRGGSWPNVKSFRKVSIAKQQALLISLDPMVPGLVEVRDLRTRKEVIAYQQGKINRPLGSFD